MVDWSAGAYEKTAAELEPAARAVVDRAGIVPSDVVIDVACGTGNAALLAAARGAQVIGVDGAPRLLEVGRDRARTAGVAVDFREGDLQALPVDDDSADVVLSIFGLIFASEPVRALHEVARILKPTGRALVSAWIPAGPIDAMLTALGQIVGRVTPGPRPTRLAWAEPDAVAAVATEAGLTLRATTRATLPIRAASPEDYIDAAQDHPMALAVRPLIERAGLAVELREAMIAALRAGNEEEASLLVHSPYAVHELRVA